MFRISLINMPFANLQLPSIALTQIRSITQSQFPGELSVNIATLTHDFAKYAGVERYQYISSSIQALLSGLGAGAELKPILSFETSRGGWSKEPLKQIWGSAAQAEADRRREEM
jgi:hypothetical protein